MGRSRSVSQEAQYDADGWEHTTKKAKTVSYIDLTEEHEPAQAKSTLCERCAAMEQNNLFGILDEMVGSDGPVSLGTLDPAKSPSCQLCQLFAAITDLGTDERASKDEYLVAFRVAGASIWGMRGSLLTVSSSLSIEDIEKAVYERGSICKATSWWPAGPGPQKSAIGLSINPQGVDFKQVRHWIDSCLEYHTKCKRYADNSDKPIELKLIDCETRKVVRPNSPVYVALSYVWGLPSLGSGYDDRPKDGRLPDNLLPTIEDALSATRKLGYRYIWIDRFCIDQTNKHEKEVQIGQMNLIYRHAEVTIVAVAGSDPRYGLPGLGNRARVLQPKAYVGGAQYVSVGNNPSKRIQESTWNSRGWTYQEQYFSRRRLYFLEDKVYFSCYDGSAMETVCHINQKGKSYASKAVDDGIDEAFKILSHLTAYSGRQLTNSSDAINAVAGVFNDYGFKDGPTAHHLGIPIVRLSEWNSKKLDPHLKERKRRVTDAFLNGLSWLNCNTGRRRNIWPSWTWAEWEVSFDYRYGPLSYMHKGSDKESFAAAIKFQHPLPKVVIEKSSGTLLDLELPHALKTIKSEKNSLSNFIHISSWTCKLRVHLMEDEHKSLFAELQLPEKGEETSSRCMREFFGTFEDPAVGIRLPLWPLHPSIGEDSLCDNGSLQFAPGLKMDGGGGERNITAIVLSRVWFRHAGKPQWRFMMMLLQNKGTHFEKIGHCSINSPDIRALGLRRRIITEADWPDDNHHATPTRYITKVMDNFMRWRQLRIG